MKKKVIVISAHPDDEMLGCGGTLLKHVANGDQVDWLITTSIFTSQGFSKERVLFREEEVKQVKNKLGFNKVYKLGYPTMCLTDDSLLKMIPEISKIFNESKPEIIYVLNRSDAHSDHNITFRAVMACTKSFRYPFIKRVLMYECISETEFGPTLPENVFIPTYYVDISLYRDRKNEIMSIYESEIGDHPFPRSYRNMDALSTFRGATIGVEYAEAFQVLRWIDK
ncbi:PIG-L deacetylase family protein [Urechidicola vernalis]|uniref:PIG-L family deacetylase n=1 Tax=Urechidicola vernalis TaxID=3075600 RepID=A0ABU2Y7H1_9FLAO|nr:PIG-L family deacetylase [Urechidicola sp. P050]MDT0554150.1 PIG-L family deacetylase [Urechidicola sp. P050]